MKALLNSFHLSSHTLRLHAQSETLIVLTQGLTLGVKGLQLLHWYKIVKCLHVPIKMIDLFLKKNVLSIKY